MSDGDVSHEEIRSVADHIGRAAQALCTSSDKALALSSGKGVTLVASLPTRGGPFSEGWGGVGWGGVGEAKCAGGGSSKFGLQWAVDGAERGCGGEREGGKAARVSAEIVVTRGTGHATENDVSATETVGVSTGRGRRGEGAAGGPEEGDGESRGAEESVEKRPRRQASAKQGAGGVCGSRGGGRLGQHPTMLAAGGQGRGGVGQLPPPPPPPPPHPPRPTMPPARKRRGRGGDEAGPGVSGDHSEGTGRLCLSQRLRPGSKRGNCGNNCSNESGEIGGDLRLSERRRQRGNACHIATGRFLVPLCEGMKVVAYFTGRVGCVGWYDATLASVDEDAGEFVVEWDDGERKDTRKKAQHIALGLEHMCKQGARTTFSAHADGLV